MYINKVKHNGKLYLGINSQDTWLPLSALLPAAIEALSDDVDTAAGDARAAFVSPGSYIDQEYQLAKQEAASWLNGDKDPNSVPSSLADHMAMFDVDADVAAHEILATAEAWEQALSGIRRARLGGKAAVRAAETIEAAEQAAQSAIAELNAIRPAEGAL